MLSNHDLSFDALDTTDRAIKLCRTITSSRRTTRHGRNPVRNRRSWDIEPPHSPIPHRKGSHQAHRVGTLRHGDPAG